MTYRISKSRIKDRRMEMGFSQEEFALKIGVALSTLRCIESGSKVPSAALLKSISVNLDCTMDYFIYEDSTA